MIRPILKPRPVRRDSPSHCFANSSAHALRVLRGVQTDITRGNSSSARFALASIDRVLMQNRHHWSDEAGDEIDELLLDLQQRLEGFAS